MTEKTSSEKDSVQMLAWETVKKYKSIFSPLHFIIPEYSREAYFYECLPWKNNFFFPLDCLWKQKKAVFWLHFQSLEGMVSPLQDYQEGISRRCLWQPSWWSMAGTLPCEAHSPGRLQLGGLTWIMFWKKHFLSWDACSGAISYLEHI